jgi:superfamily II DNA or RNA helicase
MRLVHPSSPSAAEYAAFLASKRLVVKPAGIDVNPSDLHPALFPFQRDLTRWALRKGRSALFCDTGTGKTLMQLAWAQYAAERVLILAPLAVARQTVAEGARFGIPVTYARSQTDTAVTGITITNYEMLRHFDVSAFGAVVLDESSILKAFDGKTRTTLIEAFAQTPMRLCCTATPAPNDHSELANHAEFLGLLTRAEMLATFFVHDENGWRLKGHARQPFYRWLASWGMSLHKPSDLGYDDDGYVLPELRIEPVIVPAEYAPPGQLFAVGLHGISDRAAVRKSTIQERVDAAVALVCREPDEPWLLWCGRNDEADALTAAIPNSVQVQGKDDPEHKAAVLMDFAEGRLQTLVTKVSIAGFGLNLQRCARMAFVGLSDSYEQYYQAIRRCWRYGQQRAVHAYVVLTDLEETIYANVLRKEAEADKTARELVKYVAAFERAEIGSARERDEYSATMPMQLPSWLRPAA